MQLIRNNNFSIFLIFLMMIGSFPLVWANPHGHKDKHADEHKVENHGETAHVKSEEPKETIDHNNRAIAAPCGILEAFSGDVQILDSTRTQVVYATPRAVLSCGSWLSVNHGWAHVRHQNGPYVHLGKDTFVQFPNFRTDEHFKGDHVVLYKGQVFVQVGDGSEEFRLVSSVGRARVKHSKVIFIFNRTREETQLIALQNSATLENRFEPSRRVKIQAGEATELNFKLLRVIPKLPTAVTVASLRPKMLELGVADGDLSEIIHTVLKRQGRTFADPSPSSSPSHLARKLASQSSPSNYLRHTPKKPDDEMLHAYWMRRMMGGELVGDRLLFPQGRTEKLNHPLQKKEEVEKKHLIEALSQIQMQ